MHLWGERRAMCWSCLQDAELHVRNDTSARDISNVSSQGREPVKRKDTWQGKDIRDFAMDLPLFDELQWSENPVEGIHWLMNGHISWPDQ